MVYFYHWTLIKSRNKHTQQGFGLHNTHPPPTPSTWEVSGETANSTIVCDESANYVDLTALGESLSRRAPRHRAPSQHPPPRRRIAMGTDPKPSYEFRSLDGYHGRRNPFGLLECFKDCRRQRLAGKGVARRGNLLAHLRKYHEQQIPYGGG